MKTLTVRDVRHRWPEAEALLQQEGEILITRDSRPVARLVRVAPEVRSRRRFDPVAHERWQRRMTRGRVSRWVDRALAEARADRRAAPRRS
jgi:antitoxin (DNA-binding transcriptional repressor) of toxin-antitoxin stability system